jgi:CRP/FNR family transcriptional regulator, cyclic AMP receptor protein
MNNLNWEDLFKHHPILSSLDDKEIERLLEDGVSQEREFPQGSVILREKELGNSIFWIGSGSVQVVLAGRDGLESTLTIFRTGEFFGEMAVLQQRPRSATIIANERCIVLEIKGDQFLKLLHAHPDIEFKILLILSERLRQVNDQILAVSLKDIDEKLKFFKNQLDTELKVFDASMKAAQTVFDQTRMRTDEVINSAERSRTRMSFFITTGIAVLGLLGFAQFLSVKDVWKESAAIHKQVADIQKDARTVQEIAENTKLLSGELDNARKMIDANRSLISDVRGRMADHIFFPEFSNALDESDDNRRAIIIYEDILQLKSGDPNIRFNRLEILSEISKKISSQNKSNFIDYSELFWKILGDDLMPEEKMMVYFMLLTNALLVGVQSFDNGKTYEITFSEFRRYVTDTKGQKLRRWVVESLEKLFNEEVPEKKESFLRFKKLISTY